MEKITDYKYALDESSIVAITDQKGIIIYVNNNFCKISKYSAQELIGQDHRIINSGYHSKEFFKDLWTTISNGKVWKGELKNKAKDGTIYWVDTTIVPFLNEEGKPYQYVAIRSDITERKKAEETIIRINEELEQKVIERTQVLELSNAQLIDFCNTVSHNLRAPLVNISMLIDFIEESDDEQDKKEMFAKIKPVIKQLNEVFSELVESLQVRQDAEIESEKIILQDCINKALKGFESQIKLYEATVQIDLNGITDIYFPEKYIDSIFSNLISNALKFRSPKRKPVIKIKTEKMNERIALSVSDNGLGIDMERYKDKLFKIRKVFHVHPEAKGFGLFMTKTQVEAMGGKLWAESCLDKGSTFFIEFINQDR